MRRPGPLHTLVAGLIFALALALFGRTAASPEEAEEYGQAAKTAETATGAPLQQAAPGGALAAAAAKPETAAQSASAARSRPRATYAARAKGSRAVVAITVRGDDAIAYVCDGHSLETWLRG